MATTPVSTDYGSVTASVTATLFDVIATSISSVSVGDTVYETQTLAGLNDTSLVNGGMGTSEATSDDSEGNYVLVRRENNEAAQSLTARSRRCRIHLLDFLLSLPPLCSMP